MTRPMVIAAAPRALDALKPLIAAYREEGAVQCVRLGVGVPGWDELAKLAASASAILLVGSSRRSPRTTLPGPMIRAADRRLVPVGWLPDLGPVRLGRFAAAAAKVRRRHHGGTVAVLAQRSRRYRRLAGRMVRLFTEAAHEPLNWTADELVLADLVRGLGYGPGAAVYVGHGRPTGWVGYGGVRAHHFDGLSEPVGAVFSLTCFTASRWGNGLSFAEALPLQGAAAGVLAAVGPTDHLANARWALRLVDAACAGVTTLGALVAAVPPGLDVGACRIVGDPLAPLADAPDAAQRSRRLSAACALEVVG